MNRRQLLLGGAGVGLAPFVYGTEPSEWTEVFEIDGARIRLIVRGALALEPAVLTEYVRRCTQGVAAYYGRYPTPISEIVLTARAGGTGWGHGRAFGGELPRVKVGIGSRSSLTDLASDWVFVHELVHLACPLVADQHHWLEEGLSTYVEPWIRVPLGEITPQKAWKDLVVGLPQGQPHYGDKGLDHTPTWGRTYWGGALFCLLADVRMRRANPRMGLQQAFQGLVANGGGMHQWRSMEPLLAELDGYVGGTVLTDLWKEHRETPVTVDLNALWAELGVGPRGGLRDAPGAAIRRAICPEKGT